MKHMYKNKALLVLLLSILILVTAFIGLSTASDRATLYIRDIKGDRGVLDDVVIRGVLQDMYHGQHFEIAGVETHKRLRYYTHRRDIVDDEQTVLRYGMNTYDGVNYYYTPRAFISPDANVTITESHGNRGDHYDNMESSTREGNMEYSIRTMKADKMDIYVDIFRSPSFGRSNVRNVNGTHFRYRTGIRLEGASEDYGFEFTEEYFIRDGREVQLGSSYTTGNLPSDNAAAMAYIEDQLYFTILTTPEFSGYNGIYTVTEFSHQWFDPGVREPDLIGSASEITRFDLDDHNIHVLGLEVVDDKLVLVMIIDSVLTLRVFDPVDGSMLGELAVMTVDPNLRSYKKFISNNTLSISYPHLYYDDGLSPVLISARIDEDVTLLHLAQRIDTGEAYTIASIEQISEQQGRLFVFADLHRQDEYHTFQMLQPRYLTLFVYDNDELLYRGELVSDLDQDYLPDRMRPHFSYGYTPYQFRRFDALSVEKR